MTLPDQILLTDLLKHRVRCDQGLDHGSGLVGWMHPPVHRLLGWASKPSNLRLSRDVWRLDQLRGLGSNEVYVKGEPSFAEQSTIDRIPTLLNSEVLNIKGERLGSIVDFLFDSKTGKIINYFLARTDARIPGTSRWRLLIEHIVDQQPGMVSTNFNSIEDLPLARSSLKQDFLQRSRNWKEQFQDFTDQAGSKLEGWFEESPWEESFDSRPQSRNNLEYDPLDNWDDDQNKETNDELESSQEFRFSRKRSNSRSSQDDPWI